MSNTWKQLYPDGNAFDVSDNTNRAKLHRSLDLTFDDYISHLGSLVKGALASDGISESEVAYLEDKYGVYFVDGLTLEQRILKVRERMKYPNGVVNRSSAAWIEHVLSSFGFDVKVVENNGINPALVSGVVGSQYGNTQYGGGVYGGMKYNVIGNSMFSGESYNYGGNTWATFFIKINTPIESSRVSEFRELVLKLKPAHLCAFIVEGNGIGDFNNDFNNDYLISKI